MSFLKRKKPEIKIEKVSKKEPEKKKDLSTFQKKGKLAVDFFQTPKHLIIQAAVAAVKVDDLDISVENDMLVIKGKRENPSKKKKNYFFQECFWGSFARKILLPEKINKEKIKAEIEEGVLTIKLPRIKTKKKKKIKVKEK